MSPSLCHSRSASSRPRSRANRRGLSLLEVLLALAVFGAGIVAMMHCLHASQLAGARAQFATAALVRCKTVHALLEGGSPRPRGRKPVPFDDDANWTWTTTEKPARVPGLVERTVEVEYARQRSRELGRQPRTFHLTRIVPETAETLLGRRPAKTSARQPVKTTVGVQEFSP